MKIRLTDLKNRPCDKYYNYIKEHYGDDDFDPMKVLKVLNANVNSVRWLIENSKLCKTKECFDYYKSLRPDAEDVSWLSCNCKKFREYEEQNENKI